MRHSKTERPQNDPKTPDVKELRVSLFQPAAFVVALICAAFGVLLIMFPHFVQMHPMKAVNTLGDYLLFSGAGLLFLGPFAVAARDWRNRRAEIVLDDNGLHLVRSGRRIETISWREFGGLIRKRSIADAHTTKAVNKSRTKEIRLPEMTSARSSRMYSVRKLLR
ncbi:MAG: hypothetical protein IH851_00930 [Armatimonadetes bacterium]|nr:hypothetical protein [Armatimonadota bacterium]